MNTLNEHNDNNYNHNNQNYYNKFAPSGVPRLHFEEYGFSNKESEFFGMNGLVSKNSTAKRALQGRNNTISPISSKMLLSSKAVELDPNNPARIGLVHNTYASSTKRTKSSCSGKNNSLQNQINRDQAEQMQQLIRRKLR